MRPLLLLTTFTLLVGSIAAADEMVENPEYASWSQFKKGTSITVKSVSVYTEGAFAGRKSEMIHTVMLKEITATTVVVEEEFISSGSGRTPFKTSPKKKDILKQIVLPKGVDRDEFEKKLPGTVEEGTEVLKILGTEYKTRWFKTKVKNKQGDVLEAKTWLTDEVPGRLVWEENTNGGKDPAKGTRELIDFKKP